MAEDDTTPSSDESPASEQADTSGTDEVPYPEPILDEHHYGDDQAPTIWALPQDPPRED
jgi:hypothetical protein